MANDKIYLLLGGIFMVYLIVTILSRNKSKARKSREFMEDYKRKDKK